MVGDRANRLAIGCMSGFAGNYSGSIHNLILAPGVYCERPIRSNYCAVDRPGIVIGRGPFRVREKIYPESLGYE